MRIGLAVYEFRNNDIPFNLSQMEKALQKAHGHADLLCFGETFLQGFDALSWTYEEDKRIAVSRDSEIMNTLCRMTLEYGTDLLTGYIEKDAEALYSSCAVISGGKIIHNYRRISKGWKEFTKTDSHYREGTAAEVFEYKGRMIQIALCGDLWDFPERFVTDKPLFWPVYVNYSLAEWQTEAQEYACQAGRVSPRTLMVNSVSGNPDAFGGAYVFENGKVSRMLSPGQEGILFTEL